MKQHTSSLSPATSKALEYAETHFREFVEELKKLVRIPSVSAQSFDPKHVKHSAEAVAELLKKDGFENVEVISMKGAHPYVYGDWLHAEGKPTVLLYAHHDVQPAGREALWTEPPFEPVEKNGRLTGRGSADDKAGVLVHAAAVRSYLQGTGKLPLNVKFVVEGEEEVGSESLGDFLTTYREKLKSDAIILTDTQNFDTGIPTITTSLRGIVNLSVELRGLERPIHSGMWSGPAPDPVMGLTKMLASLVDDDGRILVPGIYEQVRPLTPVEMESIKSLNYTEEDFRKQAGLLPGVKIIGGKELPLVKMSRIPTLVIRAFEASSKKDVSNRLNESAWAAISIRSVPDMDEKKTLALVKDFLKKQVPWGMQITFDGEDTGPWWITDPNQPALLKSQKALQEAFGRECVFLGQGGSIPFVKTFTDTMGDIPAILIGVEDPYTNAHSENESLDLGDFKKSIAGAICVYEALAEL